MVSRGKGYGGQRHGGDYEGTAGREGFGPHRYDVARYVNAGEVRQGSEAKGNEGRVEVRQARSDAAMNAMLRKDKAGEERLGEVGCGLQRQDAAG